MGRKKIDNKVHDHDLYNTWCCIKQRCYNAKHTAYKYYGELGVTVADVWINDFKRFSEDVGQRPSKEHSLDRFPNKESNYEPGNVRWATVLEQARNRRKRHSITKFKTNSPTSHA